MHLSLRHSLLEAVLLSVFLWTAAHGAEEANAAAACTQSGSTRLAEIVTNSIGNMTTNYTLYSACPKDITYGQVAGICYGKYAVQPNTYATPPANTNFLMWSKSASCWGIKVTEPNNPSKSYWNAPLVTRGWSYGYNAPLTAAGGLRVSGLNAKYSAASTHCAAGGAANSVCVKWTMSVPGVATSSAVNTASKTYTNWNALLDIYFHAVSDATHPSNTTDASFDLQIYQMVMDWQASNGPNWATNVIGTYTTKTIGGVPYLVTVNTQNPGTLGANWVGNGGSLNTVALFVMPTFPTSATGKGSYRWGAASVTHDVGGIIAWLSQTETRAGVTGIFDDAGHRLWDNVRQVRVASPLLNPKHYLTGLNPGFEVISTNTSGGTYPNNIFFNTTDYWVALPNETVGQ